MIHQPIARISTTINEVDSPICDLKVIVPVSLRTPEQFKFKNTDVDNINLDQEPSCGWFEKSEKDFHYREQNRIYNDIDLALNLRMCDNDKGVDDLETFYPPRQRSKLEVELDA